MERMYCRGKKENTVIGIRADGNDVLGMGHLMRCLSIAGELRLQGAGVVFLTADDWGKQLIQKQGFEHWVLGTDYTCMEAETAVLKNIIADRQISLLLVDSYQATNPYLETVREWVKVVCLEEELGEVRPADGIINYNIYAPGLPYKEKYPQGTFCYLGSNYAPVRPEFAKKTGDIREHVTKILLTMGGSDLQNINGKLLRAFLDSEEPALKTIEFEVVCGAFSPHRESLQALEKDNPRVHIRIQVEDMAALMEQCDIAVSAAGSTMYELAALGIPTVCCYYVENQRQIAEGFARFTKAVNAGDYTKEPEAVQERILQTVTNWLGNFRLRQETAESMRAVSDGRGAGRLSEELLRDFAIGGCGLADRADGV